MGEMRAPRSIDNYRSVATFIIIWAVINIKDKGGIYKDASLLRILANMQIIKMLTSFRIFRNGLRNSLIISGLKNW